MNQYTKRKSPETETAWAFAAAFAGYVIHKENSNAEYRDLYVAKLKRMMPEMQAILNSLSAEIGDGNAADTPRFTGDDLAALAGDGALRIKKDELRTELVGDTYHNIGPNDKVYGEAQSEILIVQSERGYKFRLPVRPCEAAIRGMKVPALGITYHEATPQHDAYRLFPIDQLGNVIDLLRYWFVDAPGGKGEFNRNGGKRLAVRVEDAK